MVASEDRQERRTVSVWWEEVVATLSSKQKIQAGSKSHWCNNCIASC